MSKYWLLVLPFIAIPSWAVQPFAATPEEAAMCQARVYSRLGPRDQNTMHMHHYCSGLRMLNRAYANISNKSDVRFNAGRAISNFDYVLEHTEKNYLMRGEVHLNKGLALKLIGRKAEAVAEFNNALGYDIAAPEAYQALADHYLETGNRTKALEMATEGLKRNPDSKRLKRRYTELGGTLPYPEPRVPAQIEIQAAKPAEEAVPSVHAPAEAATVTPAPATTAPESSPPKIGSPTNPFCRFCPD